jgi:hypothetical protein
MSNKNRIFHADLKILPSLGYKALPSKKEPLKNQFESKKWQNPFVLFEVAFFHLGIITFYKSA